MHFIYHDYYRPFDKKTSGFVYGQSSGAIILESKDHARKRDKKDYGKIVGYGTSLDANRNPNPSVNGELLAMSKALEKSQLKANDIDYVNAHGTGSALGDKTEIEALSL